jgi:hypothetical protein
MSCLEAATGAHAGSDGLELVDSGALGAAASMSEHAIVRIVARRAGGGTC